MGKDDRSGPRLVYGALDVKAWLPDPPSVATVRPGQCPRCGRASRPVGRGLGLSGHGGWGGGKSGGSSRPTGRRCSSSSSCAAPARARGMPGVHRERAGVRPLRPRAAAVAARAGGGESVDDHRRDGALRRQRLPHRGRTTDGSLMMSTDDVAVAGYQVYRHGTLRRTTPSPSPTRGCHRPTATRSPRTTPPTTGGLNRRLQQSAVARIAALSRLQYSN
jgi:hypothetical protein